MEASKLRRGAHYAFRTAARGSRYGNDYRQRVIFLSVIPEVLSGYVGYTERRKLCEKYGVGRDVAVVKGKAILLCEYVDPATLEGNGKTILCSPGCITSTWLTHVESTRSEREAHEKRVAEQATSKAEREAANKAAMAALIKLNDDMVNLLALNGVYIHTEPDPVSGEWRVAINYSDLLVLVENAVEMAGGRP